MPIPFWFGLKSGSPTPLHNPLLEVDTLAVEGECRSSEMALVYTEIVAAGVTLQVFTLPEHGYHSCAERVRRDWVGLGTT